LSCFQITPEIGFNEGFKTNSRKWIFSRNKKMRLTHFQIAVQQIHAFDLGGSRQRTPG
jgi:hypothetical protein